ncbi:MAG: sugar phosphate isomerase/epimerase [Victivallales bacterium]|nr:sugar phosphate isomerase/epimerase [Victivallales bacterium]
MYKYALSIPDGWIESKSFCEASSKAKLKRVEFSCNAAVMGARAVRLANKAAKLQEAGVLEIGSVHIPFGAGWSFASPDEELRREAVSNTLTFLDATKCLNCKNYTLHTCLEPVLPEERAASMVGIRETIAELLPMAQRMGISLNLEDLPRSCLGNTPEELAEIIDGFPKENVGVCFDVNHFCNCAERIPSAIDMFADRIRTFHISDYDGEDECHWYPGYGVIDWEAVMAAVRRIEQDVLLIFEVSGFLKVQPRRELHYEHFFKAAERNIFYMENVVELKKRINEVTIL